MTVRDLNRDQLNELKQAYAIQLAETEGEKLSYGELANATDIPDDAIFNHYEGIVFTDDDFACTVEDRIKIDGIIFALGDENYELWNGFSLTKEEENTIMEILMKHVTEGCSVRGTWKEIMEDTI